MTADLAEENTTAAEAAELLEQESAERMRLEKELRETQVSRGVGREREEVGEGTMVWLVPIDIFLLKSR